MCLHVSPPALGTVRPIPLCDLPVVAQATLAYDANGNLLTESHTNTTGSPTSISRSFTHNPNGTLATATDFNSSSHITSYTYGSGSCNGAFPTSISLPMSISIPSITWNCNGGVIASFEDANSQPTTFTYNDPNHFWRVTGVSYPDGGNTTITYTDTPPNFTVANSQEVTASANHQTTQVLDGLGRITQYQDNSASTYVDTLYDSLGRVYTVSNPYATKSDPTYGLTTYGYDALNRATSVEAPDGSTTLTTYSTKCGTTTDPASKMRKLCSDGLGRMTSVTEDPNGLDYQTTYSYDSLNDLRGVSQSGQTRTYAYDMLARLTSAQTPEVNVGGTQCATTYGYDANGNLKTKVAPLANQGTSCTNTVTTTYAYDALNRLTSKTYSDGTPTVTFSYDQTSVTLGSWSSGTLLNPKGRMTEATTTASGGVKTGVVYSYDPVGRISDFWQCNPGNCGTSSIYNMTYGYDKAGDVTSWTHPGLISLTNTVNSAQQVTQVQTTSQYTNLPQTLAQNVTYEPWGAVSTFEDGCSGSGCTNAQETYQYNKQLQPAVIELGTSGGNAAADYCLVYNYYGGSPTSCALPSAGTTNNGNVMGYWYQDSVNSSFSHTATYGPDGVNRLSTATATGNSTYNLTFKYDAYGNMACVQSGSTNGPCPQWTYNTSTNQLSSSTGCTYDAAGNLTKDCSTASNHTYQWDAEGRVSSVDPANNPPTWTFTYNALGERVQMAGPAVGTQELMYDPNGVWLGIYGVLDTLPWGGGFFAWYNGTDTYFHHINNISSTTMMTNHAGTTVEDMLFYPWGDVWRSWGGGGYNFAEMPYYDPVTNTSLTPFRLQSHNLGRWLSPDPLGGNVTNPQSLNRYAYVINNPTSLTDPLGLQGCDPGDPDCCDPFDPTCTPPPSPCNPEEDPWDCQWQPPPSGPGGGGAGSGGGSTGSSAGNPPSSGNSYAYPCLSADVVAQLEKALLGAAAGALGSSSPLGPRAPIGPKEQGVIGGADNVYIQTPNPGPGAAPVYVDPSVVAASSSPNPVFEPGWSHQLIVPATTDVPGPGIWVHVLFNTGDANAQGQILVTAAKVHADIANPQDVAGILRHIISDWIIATRNSGAQNGCAVKMF